MKSKYLRNLNCMDCKNLHPANPESLRRELRTLRAQATGFLRKFTFGYLSFVVVFFLIFTFVSCTTRSKKDIKSSASAETFIASCDFRRGKLDRLGCFDYESTNIIAGLSAKIKGELFSNTESGCTMFTENAKYSLSPCEATYIASCQVQEGTLYKHRRVYKKENLEFHKKKCRDESGIWKQ